MATLALGPAFRTRTRSGSKRHRRQREQPTLQPRRWRTIAVTAGTIVLTSFFILAPMIGDPSARLFALDATPTIPAEEPGRDVWTARTFEFTPTTLGPAIDADLLTLAEEDGWAEEEDGSVVTMPEFEVRAAPPI